jgi:hypothetical protein
MGEYFRDNKMHALIIYDGLSTCCTPSGPCKQICARLHLRLGCLMRKLAGASLSSEDSACCCHRYEPSHCRLRRLDVQQARQCLNNKRLAFVSGVDSCLD